MVPAEDMGKVAGFLSRLPAVWMATRQGGFGVMGWLVVQGLLFWGGTARRTLDQSGVLDTTGSQDGRDSSAS